MSKLSQPLMNLIYAIRHQDYSILPHKLNLFYAELAQYSNNLDADKIFNLLESLPCKALDINLEDIYHLNQFACSCIHYAPEAFITTGKLYKIISGLLAYKQLHPDQLIEPIISEQNLILFYQLAQEDTVILHGISLNEKIAILIKYELLKLNYHSSFWPSLTKRQSETILDKLKNYTLLNNNQLIIEELNHLTQEPKPFLNDFLEYCFACLPNATQCWLIKIRDVLETLHSILTDLKKHNEQLQLHPRLETNQTLTEHLMQNHTQIQSQRASINSLCETLQKKFAYPINSTLLLEKITFNLNLNRLYKKTNELILNLEKIEHRLKDKDFLLWHAKNTCLMLLKKRHTTIKLNINIQNAYTENQSLCLELNT